MLARDSVGARPRGAVLAAVGIATLVGAAVRLLSLRALPVFGDEAIFLRMAVLIRKAPIERLWIFFQEAQAPLHVWLLALLLPVSSDPVFAGRLLSAAAGIVSVPAAAWVALRTAEAFGGGKDSSRAEACAAAVLAALCPFFVFAQRIARLDALFLLETILAAGLSIELAFRASSRTARLAPAAFGFGILMGATMLTRQAVSYPLWLLPPIGWALLRDPRRPEVGGGRRLLGALGLAGVVAAALWVPMLAAPGPPDAMTRIFFSSVYRPAMSLGARLSLALSNFRLAGEAFFVYLTPPVLVLAALGALNLAAAARWRLIGFLLLWETLLLAPACVFAVSYFPRYALPAAFPILIASAHGASRSWAEIGRRAHRPAARAALAVVLGALVIGPSLWDLWRGERNWRDWRFLRIDRDQFVSGPSAGFASEAAAEALRGLAAEKALAVLTPEISGNPTDAMWLLLDGDPRVRLSYAIDALRRPLLPPAQQDGTRLLPGDSRDPLRRTARLPPEEPVFAVVTDPLLTQSGWVRAVPFLAPLNPGLREIARFENPAEAGSVANAVVVIRLGDSP